MQLLSARQVEIDLLVLLLGVKEGVVGQVTADSEGALTGVALPVGTVHFGRSARVGYSQVGSRVGEHAGRQVDRVSFEPVHDIAQTGQIPRHQVGDVEHRPT